MPNVTARASRLKCLLKTCVIAGRYKLAPGGPRVGRYPGLPLKQILERRHSEPAAGLHVIR